MPPKRYSQPKKSQVDIEITTAQKVMLGVALLASIGAFAAGFAAIPNANCNKGDKNCFTKTGIQTTSVKTGQITTSIKTSQATTQPKLPSSSVTASSVEKIKAGSLVIASDNVAGGVYYKGTDGKLAKFESMEALQTWIAVVKYNNVVVKITQKQINSAMSGQRILLRPGSKLLKVGTEPTVLYVCEKDSVCRVSDAVTASNLMGTNWNNNILTITKAQEGLYKKVKSLYNGVDISSYTQQYLSSKYPTIDKYLGL